MRGFGPALLCFIALPTLLYAQGPRVGGFPGGGFGRQWWDNPVANGLNLSEAQNTQIRAIVREYRTKLIDLRASEDKAQGDLQDVFNDTPNDQRRANDAIDRLASARAEATKTLSQMSLRLRNVLTAEQWQQLRDREQNRFRGRGIPGGNPDSKASPDSQPDPNRRRRGSKNSDGDPAQAFQGGPPPAPGAVKPPQH
jgi:Spy/CpxP family protein refolding chaperone